jgi:hypothetical protein
MRVGLGNVRATGCGCWPIVHPDHWHCQWVTLSESAPVHTSCPYVDKTPVAVALLYSPWQSGRAAAHSEENKTCMLWP